MLAIVSYLYNRKYIFFSYFKPLIDQTFVLNILYSVWYLKNNFFTHFKIIADQAYFHVQLCNEI